MSQSEADVLFWTGLAAIVIVLGGLFVAWLFDRSTSEIADKQSKALPEQITKEFNRRPRMRVVRFFNAFFD